MRALFQFKQHLVDHSHWLSSWDNDAEDCCKWEGVKCSNKTGHVFTLDLPSNWLYDEPVTKYLEVVRLFIIRCVVLLYTHLSLGDGMCDPCCHHPDASISTCPYVRVGSVTQIAGTIPLQLGNLSGLISLDLSLNYDLSEAYNLDWLIHLSSLTYLDLDLRWVNLSQVVNWPNKVMMLPSLIHLILYSCSLSTTTPQLLSINASSSSQLLFLDLSNNYVLMEAHNLDWLIHLLYLTCLDMSGVNLSQELNWLNKVMMLPFLKHLSLSDCILPTMTSQLLSINASSSSQLLSLDLSLNNLNYAIFCWLFNSTTSLVHFDLEAFGSLNSLQTLKLKGNQLVGGSIPKYFENLCALESLYLSDNNFNGNLYEFISNLSNLEILDVASNSLTGVISEAHFSNLSKLKYLCLGLNSLILKFSYNWIPPFQLRVIDLSSNQLNGSIPHFPSDVASLYLSNNSFFGNIFFICEFIYQSLFLLDLSNNKLSGNYRDACACFVGKLRLSLQNCNYFTTINVGENKLPGLVPSWIGDSLPRSGKLQCIKNLTSMSQKWSASHTCIYSIQRAYVDHEPFVWKGMMAMFENSLGLVKIIDLSSNKLHGEIPEELTSLTELSSLNLSRNNFTGSITLKIGLLQNLKSLDLSRNQLCGEIPMSISDISFLSYLDLSNYNLSGKIPIGTQFHSLNASAFMGNPKLYGSPLPNKCPEDLYLVYNDTRTHRNVDIQENVDDGLITQGFYVAMALGFVVGFLGDASHFQCSNDVDIGSTWQQLYVYSCYKVGLQTLC
ncbi:hypothetical protein CIPAW_05G209600 [Carya illinoinensis]|uniref:Leucine-rich repeat-containing N-terminal plant-type domain-containing protein n=1 Tax=Carya illinoinensis TaxID=32201 RepID=A0A8T1QKK1_CARIL|nr:hypothetical protein CIPAW_05G209600 [Carya illinoinensis]